jgi:hypothetical protein
VFNSLRKEAEDLVCRFFESNILKPTLDLRPFLAAAGRNVCGVTVEALVEGCQDKERLLRTSCSLG